MQRSDTILLSEKLQMAGEKLSKITMEAADPVVDVLRSIQGPFAVTWLHETAKRVYFAHDRFGRRSLLYRIWGPEFATNELARFVLSNVAIEENEGGLDKYQELPASGIYVLDLQARQLPCPTMALETITDQETLLTLEASARALMVALSNAVGVRVRSIPSRSSMDAASPPARVAVLLSGGLDSVVLAALSHFHAPKNEPVDLLTVCFDENSRFASPDRRAAELAHAELCGLFPERQWNFVKINVTRAELSSVQQEVLTLMAPCDTHMDFNIGAAFWFLSRGRGELENCTQNSDKATLEELNAFLNPQRADLRELATEVAALALFDQIVDDILCPVHKCGRKRKNGCVLGVCKSCCFKIQRVGCRAKLVSMGFQSDAHIDLLLMLLKSKREGEQEPRALCFVLVGIGADEQLAGYGRHRTTLINGGEAALRTELEMDLGRIWKRNLGRDDRCIAAHGREARFPYLDEDVVSTIATFPVSSLCDAELPRGVGDKRALRMVAKSLGLRSCAGLAKRAIQFGSRIAKVSNNGSNRQTQGMNKFSSVN
ncbi:asparagine synthetase domain-containing protein, putative [Phytophthora infestans T30-4]|uniref:Asparagine synthetase domain-containing protein, putative n=1 Tax=Phytophthora infestans (strain T30-4) TaxID=403677 RepID=D0NR74_PHYIT|nr:asparagine synthetase domain-containing protein, putative [Phytophthora infestans T30-4]EEY63196.1 asparagine synthetase domain-containing protein, putative [Phytophthora infestans T30-4]|eukprot:XP_002898373.1 asparagine synthetase domain-containing protein, putative [Phytophthora infestans T30-4]